MPVLLRIPTTTESPFAHPPDPWGMGITARNRLPAPTNLFPRPLLGIFGLGAGYSAM